MAQREVTFSYYVVMIDYGRECEAVVNPEMTRSGAVDLVRDIEADPRGRTVAFVHLINADQWPQDITAEIKAEAEQPDAPLSPVDRQAFAFDRARDLLKHEAV